MTGRTVLADLHISDVIVSINETHLTLVTIITILAIWTCSWNTKLSRINILYTRWRLRNYDEKLKPTHHSIHSKQQPQWLQWWGQYHKWHSLRYPLCSYSSYSYTLYRSHCPNSHNLHCKSLQKINHSHVLITFESRYAKITLM